jgi:hydroxyacylglutathione hydrolase
MKSYQAHAVVGAFQCNCHLLVCPVTAKAALIDPGDDAAKITHMLEKAEAALGRKLEVEYLLHTHGHLDHIGATKKMKAAFPKAKIALHAGDEPIYKMLREQGRLFGMNYEDPEALDQRLQHEEKISIGHLNLSVIHHPGHSPGSVSFCLHEDSALGAEETLFSGDTLFKGSVGRTDLWGADGPLMFKMIRERLLTLDGDVGVRPGHGEFSTIGVERHSNPFLK